MSLINMKKFTQIIAVLLSVAFVTSCDLLKRDTFDGPDAEVTGRLLDAKTGDLINIEAAQVTTGSWWSQTTYNYGALVIMEQGWKDANGQPVSQEQHWFVRYDGHYTNNLVFAADYKVSMKLLPVYEPEKADFSLNKGSNTVDFSVIPFCRIINPAIKYDSGSKKIIATFSVELGDETKAKNITNVALCANTQLFVGCNYFNMAKNDKGAKKSNVNPGEEITLEIDTTLPANAELFKYTRDRYIRIAAMAKGSGYNSNNLYNFSKIYKISADFSKIEEVKWED